MFDCLYASPPFTGGTLDVAPLDLAIAMLNTLFLYVRKL